MRLEHNDLALELQRFDRGTSKAPFLVVDLLQEHRPLEAGVELSPDDLRWLITTAGPALLAQLDSETPREHSKGPLRETTDGNR